MVEFEVVEDMSMTKTAKLAEIEAKFNEGKM